jgi:hypothetical protein
MAGSQRDKIAILIIFYRSANLDLAVKQLGYLVVPDNTI